MLNRSTNPAKASTALLGFLRVFVFVVCALVVLFLLVPSPPSIMPFLYSSEPLVYIVILFSSLSILAMRMSIRLKILTLFLSFFAWWIYIHLLVESWNLLLLSGR